MICPNCRKEINDNSKFCIYCGSSVAEIAIPIKSVHKNISTLQERLSDEFHLDRHKSGKEPNINAKELDSQLMNIESNSKEGDMRNGFPAIVGILLIVVNVFRWIFPGSESTYRALDIDSYEYRETGLKIDIVVRLLVTIWMISLAIRRKIDVFSWAFFALFFPAISLICVGFKKVKPKKEI